MRRATLADRHRMTRNALDRTLALIETEVRDAPFDRVLAGVAMLLRTYVAARQ